MISNKSDAMRFMDAPKLVTVTGTTLTLGGNISAFKLNAGSSQNVDVISTQWKEGKRIFIQIKAGSSAITFRANQPGTNIKLVGTDITLTEFEAVRFRADLDASGNKIWVQDMAVISIT